MAKPASHSYPWVEQALPVLVFAILMMFSYALFFQAPYLGFDWNSSTYKVLEVYVPGALRPGDQLVQVGPVPVADFQANLRLRFFEGAQPGQAVPIVVERDGQRLTVPWALPGPNRIELLGRQVSQWWLAYLFWIAGTATLLLVRPKDNRWRLLVAFNYLTALWLILSSGLSHWHVWNSAILLRAALWLTVPVYWHLHWSFPQPLGRLPALVSWILYVGAAILAVAEWFQLVPPNLYALAFLAAILGSLILLAARFGIRPSQRRDTGLLLLGGTLAFAPSLVLGLFVLAGNLPASFVVAIATLPILPATYVYTAYRRQLGDVELRVNRLISLYIFFILLGTSLLLLAAFADLALGIPEKSNLIGVGAAMLAALAGVFGYPPFERLMDRRILGIRLPASELLETYAARITASPDRPALVQLLQDEILPSLLVHQSVLAQLDAAGQPMVIHAVGVESSQLPTADEVPALLAEAGRYRVRLDAEKSPHRPWARLILPLTLQDTTIGLWLLGRRDPDDFYGQRDIATLKSLAHQTTIALTNIVQAERLHALYQADIDRTETERANLGRELHDNVLGKLADLKTGVDERAASPRFFETINALIGNLRETVGGLRPPMLDFGLRPALLALVDQMTERWGNGLTFALEVPESEARYSPQVEQHLYRIVQQACDNARLHGHARKVTIQGRLDPEEISLVVEDDGVGFDVGDRLGLVELVAHKHFGLAGMFERAALIGARLEVHSAPGRGTQVQLTWRTKAA